MVLTALGRHRSTLVIPAPPVRLRTRRQTRRSACRPASPASGDEHVSDDACPHNRIRQRRAVAAGLRLGDVWITRPADLVRVRHRERERPLRGGLTIAPAQKQAPVGQAARECFGRCSVAELTTPIDTGIVRIGTDSAGAHDWICQSKLATQFPAGAARARGLRCAGCRRTDGVGGFACLGDVGEGACVDRGFGHAGGAEPCAQLLAAS